MSQTYKRKIREIGYLIFRNVFLLINVIILSVVALLFFFGDSTEAIFLGIIIVINIIVGTFQDIHAWLSLEKLDLLTALRVIRLRQDKTEERVLPQDIEKNDRIMLKLGDQVPCDGTLLSGKNVEVNEALITGESRSFSKSEGENLSAGSIVTSGSGILCAKSTYQESRIAKMTEGIKRYSASTSPIQESIMLFVRYAGYVLLLVIALVLVRGFFLNEPAVLMVRDIGALAGMLVPQGLIIATTLLFAYGAQSFFRRHILLQEMNATEKLGRIKNLCIDKTGTLTENVLTVEDMYVPKDTSKQEAELLVSAYVSISGDSSDTISTIKQFLNRKYEGEAIESLPFSSWRQYGGVMIKDNNKVILAGPPEVFMPHIRLRGECQWLKEILETHAPLGERLICFVKSKETPLPRNLSGTTLSIIAVFVLHNNLREGIQKAVTFFQERGVYIRVLSGDNPETVRAVALSAGINKADAVITGAEMATWSEIDFKDKVSKYTVFARITPEQKEKIIGGLKKNAFTAMVGDGANDALAIKKADLGIAMFDGAPATRRLASIVLTNNSFSALPEGVILSDNIVENIETLAGIFLNQTFLGFFVFVMVSILGYSYPFAPLNTTAINYFSIGMPTLLISYWAIRPQKVVQPAYSRSFLKRVVPFALVSSIFQSLGIVAVFVLSLGYLKEIVPNTPAVLAFMTLGFIFFLFAPGVYGGTITNAQRKQLFGLALIESIFLYIGFNIPPLTVFFNVTLPPSITVAQVILVAFAYGCFQYILTKRFFTVQKTSTPLVRYT